MNKIKKSKIGKIVTIVALALCVILCLAMFSKVNNMEGTKKLNVFDFQIGAINSSGVVTDSNQNLRTKDFLKVDDIKITLNDNATISYKVYFYDDDKDFISASTSLSTDYVSTTTPSTAEYCKVVITPAQVDGEAVNITLLNEFNYVNQININVKK